MFILYLDESGNTGTDYDNPTQKIFTLAGLALNDKDWYDLNYKIVIKVCYIIPIQKSLLRNLIVIHKEH